MVSSLQIFLLKKIT